MDDNESPTDITSIRALTIVRAMGLIATGQAASKKQACEMVGISVSTYDRYLIDHPEVKDKFIAEARGPLQELYTDVIKAETYLLKNIIAQAADIDLKLKDQLAIQKRLFEYRQMLENEIALIPQAIEAPALPDPDKPATSAEAFIDALKAPVLRKGQSISVQRTTTVTVKNDDEDNGQVIEGKEVES